MPGIPQQAYICIKNYFSCAQQNSTFMEKLLKVEQVADLFQVSKRTVYGWTHMDFIPHYKFPKGIRFKHSEVERWLKRRKKQGRDNYQADIIL